MGPGAAGVPGARVEMPKCLSVLQARYEFVLCVLAALSTCCDQLQLWFQDQACALGAWGNAPESPRFPPSMPGEGTGSYSVGGFILHRYGASFLHHFSSGF